MADRNDPYPDAPGPIRSTEEARAGRTKGMRKVLGISLALVVVALLLAYVIAI